MLACFCALPLRPQNSDATPLNTSGQITVDGHTAPYLIRHLPVNSFPQLPAAIQASLTRRGCLIPQSYEARQPENVVHSSFERLGSSDWAILCSAQGTVSLLVFFGDGSSAPFTLASAPETEHLQSHGASPTLGFNWAIDAASPEDVHEAQLGMHHPPPRLDHDALADSVIDRRTVYRFYSNDTWTLLGTQD
ncbi:MAG TPA: hypothetical protein VMT38_08875 [Terracidiphilus sp.]|nr:hypothetical protein [Terracidiphilus sp.]